MLPNQDTICYPIRHCFQINANLLLDRDQIRIDMLLTTISDKISGQSRITSIDSLRLTSPFPPVSMLMKTKQAQHNFVTETLI